MAARPALTAMNVVVDGRYQIIKRLGKGGFAHTYLAKNLNAPGEPKCVVKQLRPKQEHPRLLQLFKLEAAVLERFEHGQIPQLVECFEHQGDYFLVQDFVAGDDLSKEFTIGHRWSETKAIKFLHELLQVLTYVHSRHAIHRDIKPANIIRRWDNGQLCPIDFGAVQDVAASTDAPTTVVGTPGYHPPEQLEGKATFGSDIYSLGMTAIQFLTGQYPLHLPKNDDGEVLWQDATNISDGLAAILAKMTHPDLDDRYQSTAEVLADLEVLPPPVTAVKTRPVAREAGVKTLAVGVLIGLAFIATGAIVDRVQFSPVNINTEAMLDSRARAHPIGGE